MLLSKDAVTLFKLKHGPLCFKNDLSFKIPQDRISYRKDRLEVKRGSTKKEEVCANTCVLVHVFAKIYPTGHVWLPKLGQPYLSGFQVPK